MGTDIHGVFQRRDNTQPSGWVDVPTRFEFNSHYLLFAWLAGVRNGFGFAGIKTHDPLQPLSEPRGYPSDFALLEGDDAHRVPSKECLGGLAAYMDDLEVWMGDHSHSWLSADEILNAPDQFIDASGVISIEDYERWDKTTRPEFASAGIFGRGVVVAEDPADITNATTHVRVTWPVGVREQCHYFVHEVERLKNEHGEVRFVFGFDS